MKFTKRLIMLVLVFSMLLIPSIASAATEAIPCSGGTIGDCVTTLNLTNASSASIKYKVDGNKVTLAPGQTLPIFVQVGKIIKITADKKKGQTLVAISCPGSIVTKLKIKSREVRVFAERNKPINCTFTWAANSSNGSDSD